MRSRNEEILNSTQVYYKLTAARRREKKDKKFAKEQGRKIIILIVKKSRNDDVNYMSQNAFNLRNYYYNFLLIWKHFFFSTSLILTIVPTRDSSLVY